MAHRPLAPDLFLHRREAADSLEPDAGDVLVSAARPRTATDSEGQEFDIHDTVLRGRKEM